MGTLGACQCSWTSKFLFLGEVSLWATYTSDFGSYLVWVSIPAVIRSAVSCLSIFFELCCFLVLPPVATPGKRAPFFSVTFLNCICTSIMLVCRKWDDSGLAKIYLKHRSLPFLPCVDESRGRDRLTFSPNFGPSATSSPGRGNHPTEAQAVYGSRGRGEKEVKVKRVSTREISLGIPDRVAFCRNRGTYIDHCVTADTNRQNTCGKFYRRERRRVYPPEKSTHHLCISRP